MSVPLCLCVSPVFYSERNATIGSTRLARRAGIQQARKAIVRITALPVKVIGSVALTPYKKLFRRRAPVRASARPMNEPIAPATCPGGR